MAFLAGYVNASVLSYYDVPVSHMSGAVTRLGMDLGLGFTKELTAVALIIGSFFIGAIISGAIIGRDQLRPGHRYGVVLLLESVVLAISAMLLSRHHVSGISGAALACGLQNAMASSYYGLIIRTTHMTGIVTDLGAMLGHAVRHRHIDRWKLLILGLILTGFTLGAVGGVVFNYALSPYFINQLYPAALFCATIAGVQTWLMRRVSQKSTDVNRLLS